jgi:hypothetical protein
MDSLTHVPTPGATKIYRLGRHTGITSKFRLRGVSNYEQFNASVPSEDLERFGKSIADFAEKMTTYAGSAADPGEYGKLIAARLCPDTLPYELGTSAAFEVASFNGRALGDDALDVMLTLATNTPLVDGLAPDRVRIRKDFPYYGAPYTAEEQVGVTPMPRPAKK